MKILINNILINYEVSGFGRPLIFLHGWGSNLHTFDNMAEQLNEDYTIYQIDLPGFGDSEIKSAMSIENYADVISEFCRSLAIINPIVIGHSFGGRVAIKYASIDKIDKLILMCSPGIKMRFNLIKWLKVRIYKLTKKMNINLKMGSNDYKNASPILREVLVKALNTDLSDEAKKISCPTLLLYSKKDRTVPIYIGRRFKELIVNSSLFEIKRSGHFPYIDRFRFVLILLKAFMHGEKI